MHVGTGTLFAHAAAASNWRTRNNHAEAGKATCMQLTRLDADHDGLLMGSPWLRASTHFGKE